MAFQSFKSATKAADVDYVGAEINRQKIANQALQAENARKSQDVMGAMALYNEEMGDSSPISDYLSETLRGGEINEAIPVEDKSMTTAEIDGSADPYGTGSYDPNADLYGTGGYTPAEAPASAAEYGAGMDFAGSGQDLLDATDPANFGAGVDFAGLDDATAGMTDAAGMGADAAGSIPGMPGPMGAINIGAQLAEGDVGGAASSAGKSYLASMGPYGAAAAAILSMLGM